MAGRLVMLIVLVMGAPLAVADEDVAEEAEAWFVAEYVPLWRSIDLVDPVKIKRVLD